MFLEVPIIGTGQRGDAFRPKLPDGTDYSAFIPTGADGRPVFKKCLVCVADDRPIPGDGKLFARNDAVLSIKGLDHTIDMKSIQVRGGA